MNETEYKTVITPRRKWFDLHLDEIIKYKYLLFLFVKRDFIASYKQTILGPLWAVLQPLVNTFLYTLIFSNLAKIPTADIPDFALPAFLFYLAGNVCWAYFSSTVQSVSDTFLMNMKTMGKVYFPRLIAPLSTAVSHLISYGIQLCLFLVTFLGYCLLTGTAVPWNAGLLLLLPITLQMMCLSTGCGLILSAMTTKYRDLRFSIGFLLRMWQYASPVLYGLSLISNGHESLFGWYMLNPITPVLTAFRYALLGSGYFSWTYCLISWGETLLLLLIGVLLFNRMERSFIDTI